MWRSRGRLARGHALGPRASLVGACVRRERRRSGHLVTGASMPSRATETVAPCSAGLHGRSAVRSLDRPCMPRGVGDRRGQSKTRVQIRVTRLNNHTVSLHTLFVDFSPVSRPPAKHRRVWRESKIMSSASGTWQAYPVYTSGAQEDVSTAVHGSQVRRLTVYRSAWRHVGPPPTNHASNGVLSETLPPAPSASAPIAASAARSSFRSSSLAVISTATGAASWACVAIEPLPFVCSRVN